MTCEKCLSYFLFPRLQLAAHFEFLHCKSSGVGTCIQAPPFGPVVLEAEAVVSTHYRMENIPVSRAAIFCMIL